MNLGHFNRYVYSACRRVLSPRKSNPSPSTLSGQLVRPLRPSPPSYLINYIQTPPIYHKRVRQFNLIVINDVCAY